MSVLYIILQKHDGTIDGMWSVNLIIFGSCKNEVNIKLPKIPI